jgi:hypothetical protein
MDPRQINLMKKRSVIGIRKTKNILDRGQKYDLLEEDLHSIITNINSNFDFKTFNKDTLKEVEIVRIF